MEELTPRQIVSELDRYIIGQNEAKKAVAVALRNRYRRSRLPEEIRQEVTPKNILMKGPTGCGKTEIARRLAKLVKAPFIKVEASKYTEVGYVGRDVESMIRDLAEVAIRLVKEEKMAEVSEKAVEVAEKKIIDALLPSRKKNNTSNKSDDELKSALAEELKSGKLDDHMLELELDDAVKPVEIMPGMGVEMNLGEMFGGLFPKRKKKRKLTVKEARAILVLEESEKRLDMDSVNSEGVRRAEESGIIFIDEIDKIAGKGSSHGPDVSREGVQRDILPIVEGCTVQTKYGMVKTDYILFIASGAFHVNSMSDLIPELQGRFPIRVELNSLTKQDFINILTVPENALTRQYSELLKVDNINLIFRNDGIEKIGEIAEMENAVTEDIGARRLHTILEKLLQDVSFNAGGDYPLVDVIIDAKYIEQHMSKDILGQDLKRYIL